MKFVIKLMLPLSLVYSAHAHMILRFQPHITAHAQRLADLVFISNDKQDWMNIPLDSQPTAGEYLSKDQVIQWLIQKNGSFEYQWKGKKTALIEQNTLTSGKQLLNKAQKALLQQLNKTYDAAVEPDSKTLPKDSEFSLADFHVELPVINPPTKHICVRLVREKRSIPIWFRVKVWQKVLVTPKKIKSRTLVQETDFVLKKRNIAGLKAKPLTHLPETHWLSKSLNKNQILTQDQLTQTPQVIKGEAVQIKVSTHGISITAKAIAQNDGYTGQIIQMKNPDTNKYFAARIIASNQAEITS